MVLQKRPWRLLPTCRKMTFPLAAGLLVCVVLSRGPAMRRWVIPKSHSWEGPQWPASPPLQPGQGAVQPVVGHMQKRGTSSCKVA